MSLTQSLAYIYRHPMGRSSGIWRFARWQVLSRIHEGKIGIIPWVNDSVLAVKRGEHGLTGNIYCTLHENEEMSFFLRVLRQEDLFIDVGANGGSYSILAAKVRGCHAIAFEPASDNFSMLMRNLSANSIQGLVTAHQTAVSDFVGTGTMSSSSGATSQLIVSTTSERATETIAVTTLDSLDTPKGNVLVKVDVEGAEESVIRGATQFLRNDNVLAVMMEVHWDSTTLSPDSITVLRLMTELGFEHFHFDPISGLLISGTSPQHRNIIFSRRPDDVDARTRNPFALDVDTSRPWMFVSEGSINSAGGH